MRIAEIADPGSEWDAFVEAEPAGRLGHASQWAQVVRTAYGLTPIYLAARNERGAIVGVLPLVRFRGLTGGLELVSMPFLDSGGILTRSVECERALLDAALGVAKDQRAAALELREIRGPGGSRDEGSRERSTADATAAEPSSRTAVEAGKPVAAENGAASQQIRVDLVLPLERDEDAQWRALRAKVRNQTRKAESEGLTIAPRESPRQLEAFFGPFARNMRDLGSPVHSVKFFAAAADAFGERLRFIVTRRGNRSVGGLVAIDYASAVSVPWASTLREERHRCPNNQIYWEALRWAIERGAREFDFGRSPLEGGTYRFKRGWGAEERPLAWRRLSPEGERLAQAAPGDSALLQGLSKLWSRLPVRVTTWIGPQLRRRISS